MELTQHVKHHLRDDESLVLVTDTDMKRDGMFGRRWLVVTDRRIMTYADDGHAADGCEIEVPLSEIRELRTVHHVGRMALEAQKHDSRVELLSCTNAYATRFAKVAHAVTKHCKEDEPLEISLEDEERRKCESCGRPLPEADSFCPVLKFGVSSNRWERLLPTFTSRA